MMQSVCILLLAITAVPGWTQDSVATPVMPADTGYVVYRDSPVSLPLGIGLRIPAYNRVDGLALPWGPVITLLGERIEIDPTVTYRSDLGAFDPRLAAKLTSGRILVRAIAARGTLTNDAWIRSGLLNSLAAFATGRDVRNYYRADRGDVRVEYRLGEKGLVIHPYAGALTERAWLVGEEAPVEGGPWSIFGRTSDQGMRRPNPSVQRGRISSAVVGGKVDWKSDELQLRADAGVEIPWETPDNADFVQTTVDARLSFPTFLNHHFEGSAHAVITRGNGAPEQRYAYLGGNGTLAFVDLLAMGGDQLFYVDGRYVVPFERFTLPFLGSPAIALRYATGSAGVGALPDFVQNLGVRVGLRFIHLDVLTNPRTGKTKLEAGLSL